MVDLEHLRTLIDDSGMTITAVAKQSNIVRETLYNRLNGRSEFTAPEIMSLSGVLRLSVDARDQIFFAQDVDENGNSQ